MTELHRNLVRNLKRLRSSLRLSQMELAERADLSPGYVGELELGHKFPAPEALERLASALETKPYRLLMGEDDAAEWGGAEAYYAAADDIRTRILRDLDELLASRGEGDTPPVDR